MEEKEIWYNPENTSKLSEADAKFIFEQAEKQLKETSDVAATVVTRTTTLCTVVAAVLIGLIGFTISKIDTLPLTNKILLTCYIGIAYLLILVIHLANNLKGKAYYIIGGEPKSLFIDTFLETEESQRMTRFYFNEFVEYQKRISINKATNIERWRLYHKCVNAVAYLPAGLIVIYLLLSLFTACSCS